MPARGVCYTFPYVPTLTLAVYTHLGRSGRPFDFKIHFKENDIT
jgi:hypothetical protein